MGIGGALIMPATLSIITNVSPPEERSKELAFGPEPLGSGARLVL